MFSILTPTYNRVNELPRVYNSLQKQTFRDFEWIISDDGSTDGTADLVKEWQNKKLDFKIIYHVLECNKGKSYAVNEGLGLCKQPYTIIADSDDSFVSTTLADLQLIWKGIEQTDNPEKICAIWTLVKDEKGTLVGEPFPKNFWQVGFKERILYRRNKISGEKWHSWRTIVLQDYKMYVNPNSFVSEDATWHLINTDYDFLCVNLIHRMYWFSEKGLIHQKKSYKDTQKIIYYTSYYHLRKSKIKEILSTAHYRTISFDYMRSSFYYKDTKIRLKGKKLFATYLAAMWLLPRKVVDKIFKPA